ncbi:hypothetical protein DYB25_011257 [Aphanomyces astaci]|uniref:Uncharacterized protein n=1 Tax=Aphanomyces astaci TaxID=112090 RepID=A0A397CAF0_APHAT|nr:hypothetical protein DYB25_011257 [Aphanomyces astaci]RHY36851.1 hypothetical protein DYB38_007793 [Aphanomyces astaci]RHY39662.1 hypothetical protein DYB30_013266 [Aphanomyces astaci]RHZ06911.1 hypothetical protein DYB31_007072 [Aphanomyces astaci]RHZ34361.1 hypothetical protein DYB26_005416 [Aphanomyces astaci]
MFERQKRAIFVHITVTGLTHFITMLACRPKSSVSRGPQGDDQCQSTVSKYGSKKKPKQHNNRVVTFSERLADIQYYDTCGMPATLDAFYGTLTATARESMRKRVPSQNASRLSCESTASTVSTMLTRRESTTRTYRLHDSSGSDYPLFLVIKTGKSKVKVVIQENLTERQGFGKTL